MSDYLGIICLNDIKPSIETLLSEQLFAAKLSSLESNAIFSFLSEAYFE